MSGVDKPDRFIALVHPGGNPHPPGTFVDDDAPLPVTVVGGGGFPPSMVGYAEDSAHVSGDRGILIFGVRNDTPGTLVDTDGDYAPFQFNLAGELRVTTAAGGGTSGTSQPDKSTFTEGSSLFTPMGGVFNESILADPIEDQAAAARITAKRAIHVNLRDAAGIEIGTVAAPFRVDPTGSTTQPVSGTVTIVDGGGSITVDGIIAVSSVAGTVTVDQIDTTSLDYDTGGGTVNQTVLGIALPGAGGPVAGGTTANPVRVDPTGSTTQPISGTVTVATITAALPTGDNTIGRVKITDGTFTASVRDTGSNDSLNVAIVDASGNHITSFGGSVQYTEGDTDSSITGTAILWEDVADTLTPVSATKPLPVGDGGGSLTVDGTVSATQSGSWTVTIQDGGNVISIDDAGASITVDGTVAVSSVAGTVAVTQSGSWTVTADAGTGTFVVDQVDTASLDYDTGAGTVNQSIVGLALPGAGGPVAGGTATNPVRTDPTGSTTQPVSGTVAVSSVGGTVTIQDGGNVISVDDASGSLTVDGTVAVSSVGGTVTIQDGGNVISIDDAGASITVDGTLNVNVLTMPTVTIAEPVTIDGTVTAEQGTPPWSVKGTKTNDAAPPGTDNLGVLSAVATEDSPTYTEGQQVALSVDLEGNLRSSAGVGDTAQINGIETSYIHDELNRRLLEHLLLEVQELKRMFAD